MSVSVFYISLSTGIRHAVESFGICVVLVQIIFLKIGHLHLLSFDKTYTPDKLTVRTISFHLYFFLCFLGVYIDYKYS